jgi:hypothetical protein
MRTSIVLLGLLALTVIRTPSVAETPGKTPDAAALRGFLAGDYRLIGQEAGSGATYSGSIELREKEDGFAVTRIIAGVTTEGRAAIETSREGNPVLRIRFASEGRPYEGTYLWRSDLDNYPRLTGYVYLTEGELKSPGLEALFHIPPTPER